MAATAWQEKVAENQTRCREKIPKEWLIPDTLSDKLQKPLESHRNTLIEMQAVQLSGILTDREPNATEKYEVRELLEALATGKMSAVQVTTAFCKRAAVAQQLINCLTETYLEEAIERARRLDDLHAKGHLAGSLHGLPVSVKDSFQIADSEASTGYVSYLGRISEKNSALTEILLQQGAIIHVKTNIPQTLMTSDSQNNIIVRTLNPHNTMPSAGGSSGGEGATVAFRASATGIGTDIAGPLANSVDALHIMTQSIVDAQPANFDATALDVPWGRLPPSGTPRMRLGLLAEDLSFPLHLPVKRALSEAVARLQTQGHEIVALSASKCQISEATEIAFMYFGLDARTSMPHIEASGEPVVASVTEVGNASKKLTNQSVADISELGGGVLRVAASNVKRDGLRDHWRRIWREKKIDAVIAPAAQHTAVPHDHNLVPPYTSLNTLDYPACVIPFGKASKELDPEAMVMSEAQIGANYDPQVMDGAPTHVQIFTSRMRDEECLQIAALVGKCLREKE